MRPEGFWFPFGFAHGVESLSTISTIESRIGRQVIAASSIALRDPAGIIEGLVKIWMIRLEKFVLIREDAVLKVQEIFQRSRRTAKLSENPEVLVSFLLESFPP